MKKIVVVLLLVCSFSFCFAGCDGLKGEFWLETQAFAQTVFENENYNSVYNISYGDNLSFIMNSAYGSDYAEIKEVLTPLFASSIAYAYNHYNDFLQNPQNVKSSAFKKAMKDVNTDLKNFEVAINAFKEKKDLYLSYITASDEDFASKEIEKARLLNFKREYITVIEAAFSLSENIFEARRLGYYDYSNYSAEEELIDAMADSSLAVNASNLAITKCAIEIVRAHNAKEVATYYELYYTASQEFFSIVKRFENGEYTLIDNVKNALNEWKIVYEMFTEENARLLDAISKLDLELLIECENDVVKYAEETNKPSDVYYAEYYLNFYSKINLLKTYILGLFN